MKKFLLLALLCISANAMQATNIVEVKTSCGKIAHIDTDQAGSTENAARQALAIDAVLCGE